VELRGGIKLGESEVPPWRKEMDWLSDVSYQALNSMESSEEMNEYVGTGGEKKTCKGPIPHPDRGLKTRGLRAQERQKKKGKIPDINGSQSRVSRKKVRGTRLKNFDRRGKDRNLQMARSEIVPESGEDQVQFTRKPIHSE